MLSHCYELIFRYCEILSSYCELIYHIYEVQAYTSFIINTPGGSIGSLLNSSK